jgi:Secretory lipase
MFPVRKSLVWSFLVAVSSALPTFPFAISGRTATYSLTPLPPGQDPFYAAPANYESATLGTLLRVRAAPGNLTSVVANSSLAYNILYRTTNSQHKPAWAVTSLFVPSSPSKSTFDGSNNTRVGSALLSYQIPYDSADVDASPSYSLYSGSPPDIAMALGHGWYVNLPDFEGPLASFTADVQSSYATLDSVRAVLSSGFGLAPDA